MTFQPGAWRWTRYLSAGVTSGRCGSLASRGAPVTERAPANAQAFEPANGAANPEKNGGVPTRRSASLNTSPIRCAAASAGRPRGKSPGIRIAVRWTPMTPASCARTASSAASPLETNASVRFSRSSGFHNPGRQPASANSCGRSSRAMATQALMPVTNDSAIALTPGP